MEDNNATVTCGCFNKTHDTWYPCGISKSADGCDGGGTAPTPSKLLLTLKLKKNIFLE